MSQLECNESNPLRRAATVKDSEQSPSRSHAAYRRASTVKESPSKMQDLKEGSLPSQSDKSKRVVSQKLMTKIEQVYGGDPKNFCRDSKQILLSQSQMSHERISPKRESSKDTRLGDHKYVCFRLRTLEFFCPIQNFTHYSEYFSRLYSLILTEHEAAQHKGQGQQISQILINLPPEIKAGSLLFMINCMEAQQDDMRASELSLYMATELVELAHQMKMRSTVTLLLQTVIIQQVNRENVLHFLQMAYQKVSFMNSLYFQDKVPVNEESENPYDSELSSDRSESCGQESTVMVDVCHDKDDLIELVLQEESDWLDFFYYCIEMAALNLLYIAETQWHDISVKLSEQILSEVVIKTLQFFKCDPAYDSRALIQLIMKLRGCESVFQLLSNERNRAVTEELEYRQQFDREPLLTWSVKSISNGFYKQSDTIMMLDAQWRLALSYIQKQNTGLRVEIKLLNNPYDVKQARSYFKKQEYDLPSNLDAEKIDPIAKFEVENEEGSNRKNKIQELNALAQTFPTHCFISFLASVHFDFDTAKHEPELFTMIGSAKAPTELRRVRNFDLSMNPDPDALKVGVFFKMQELHAMILTYITRNFTGLINDPDIKLLRKDEFKTLLKHKHLNVTQEDDVIKAICLWLEGQQQLLAKGPRYNSTVLKPSFDSDEQRLSDAVSELLQQVNWDYVSLPCLLDVIRSKPMIRGCQSFRKEVYRQFIERMERKEKSKDSECSSDSEQDEEEEAKTIQSQPRYSYKYNKSQKQLYPTAADLRNQLGGPVLAMPKDIRQFQLVHPIQIYPDFMQHLVDCMISQVAIITPQQNQFDAVRSAEPLLSKNLQRRLLQEKLQKALQEVKFIQDQLSMLDLQEQIKPFAYRNDVNSASNEHDAIISQFQDTAQMINEGKNKIKQLHNLNDELAKSVECRKNSAMSQFSKNTEDLKLNMPNRINLNKMSSSSMSSESADDDEESEMPFSGSNTLKESSISQSQARKESGLVKSGGAISSARMFLSGSQQIGSESNNNRESSKLGSRHSRSSPKQDEAVQDVVASQSSSDSSLESPNYQRKDTKESTQTCNFPFLASVDQHASLIQSSHFYEAESHEEKQVASECVKSCKNSVGSGKSIELTLQIYLKTGFHLSLSASKITLPFKPILLRSSPYSSLTKQLSAKFPGSH